MYRAREFQSHRLPSYLLSRSYLASHCVTRVPNLSRENHSSKPELDIMKEPEVISPPNPNFSSSPRSGVPVVGTPAASRLIGSSLEDRSWRSSARTTAARRQALRSRKVRM